MTLLDKLLIHHLNMRSTSVTEDEEGVMCSFGEEQFIRLQCGRIDRGRYTPDQFSVLLVKTKNFREAQSYLLNVKGNIRIGWIFPINALVSRTEIPEDKWAKIYANFALNALIYNSEIIQYAKIPEFAQNYNILDFYDEESAVVIIGREALDNYNINLQGVQVALLKEGYATYHSTNGNNLFWKGNTAHLEKITINLISKDLHQYLEKFEFLIRQAIWDENYCASFFSIYQIIEAMLLIIFEAAVDVCKDQDFLIKNPWKLKDELNSITKESWRLDRLFNDFINPGIDSYLIEEAKSVFLDFLTKYDQDKPNKNDYVKNLYRIRNLVVHRQYLLTEEAVKDLLDVNQVFLNLCFEILSKFSLEYGKNKLTKKYKKEILQI